MTDRLSLKRVQRGDPVTATAFNALIDALQPMLRISAAFPLQLGRGAEGIRLALAYLPQWDVVELTEGLSAGGTAAAKVLWHDGTEWIDADVPTIAVADVFGTFSGAAGDVGFAVLHRQSGLWILVQLQC